MSWEDIDTSLFLVINGKHYDALDSLMLAASSKLSFIPILFIALYIGIKQTKEQNNPYLKVLYNALIVGTLFSLFLLCFYAIPEISKAFYPIQKPCANANIASFIRLLRGECVPNHMHAYIGYRSCTAVCLTVFVLLFAKKDFLGLKLVLITWSFVVAYSRIYVGDRLPINVLESCVVGAFTGFIGFKLYHYLRYNLLLI
ncbi:MAG: phosphatase PAP2 family protein [Bacteroidetes bacterium]|nr:phosphatase PAP2 family protein [Bacteroidota bacterium]